MRAAIYARKSTEEHQAESTKTQVEYGLRFAADGARNAMGKIATVLPEHIIVDDGISRDEFINRPGLARLRELAKRKVIDAVVVTEVSRIGGDMLLTTAALRELVDHGVRVFACNANREIRLSGAVDVLTAINLSFGAQVERENIVERTRRALKLKAEQGYCVGGRTFGYDVIQRQEGSRRWKEYRINAERARTIREVFERYRDGEGLRIIARDLTARGVTPPRGRFWSAGTVRAMLRREMYVGVLVWGREGKEYRGGTRVRVERQNEQLTRAVRPELRIIDDDLWNAVHDRIAGWERKEGRRGPAGPQPKYTLSGLARCGVCGGRMHVGNSKAGKQIIRVYYCAKHRDYGTPACPNSLRRPVDTVDDRVLTWIEKNVLTENLVLETLGIVRRRLAERSASANTELPGLETRAAELKSQIRNLAGLVAKGVDSPTVAEEIGEREKQLRALQSRIDATRTAPAVLDLEVRRLEVEARKRIMDLRGLCRRRPEEARRALEVLFDGPITMTPIETDEGPRYGVEGRLASGFILSATLPGGI